MTGTPMKLGAYGVALAVAFGAAFALGGTTGPVTKAATTTPHAEAGPHASTAPQTGNDAGHGGTHAAPADAGLPGLAVSARGYTLVPATTVARSGRAVPYAFAITGPDSRAVTGFTHRHEKDLHLIVVRRDLTGFQHVHPVRDATGTWTVPLDLTRPGTYRVFADSAPTALGGESVTLGTDLAVAGNFTPARLPAPARESTVDGYTVRLGGSPVAGREAELTFAVDRGGRPVTDLQPYLGASGHLVSLRAGDLAYLHTHATGEGLRFATTFPTAGTYRLFLDFRHGNRVRTAAFTVHVGGHS
jgi:hypothetical protein